MRREAGHAATSLTRFRFAWYEDGRPTAADSVPSRTDLCPALCVQAGGEASAGWGHALTCAGPRSKVSPLPG